MPTIYSLCSSLMVPNNIIGEHCHARSIVVQKTRASISVIDRLHTNDKKFEYFNTVGGFVLNREIDRVKVNSLNRINRSYMDDACSAFSFFMALFSQVFHISKSIFSNEFVELHEELNGKKISYAKSMTFVVMVV